MWAEALKVFSELWSIIYEKLHHKASHNMPYAVFILQNFGSDSRPGDRAQEIQTDPSATYNDSFLNQKWGMKVKMKWKRGSLGHSAAKPTFSKHLFSFYFYSILRLLTLSKQFAGGQKYFS